MSTIRVVQYLTSLSRSAGGLYYSVSGLSRALLDRGVDVTVVGGMGGDNFPEDRGIWGDVRVSASPLPVGRYDFNFGVLREIVRLKPDVLHIQGIWSAGSIYGLIGRLTGIKVVVSPRGMLDPWILKRSARLKGLHSTLFERPMLHGAHVHALNESERASVIQFMPSLRERVFVLPNGVPDSHPQRDLGSVRNRVGVLYLGRLHPKKQVLELVRNWKRFGLEKHGHILTIAGWGDDGYESDLRSLVGESPAVNFVGSLYGDRKIHALQNARFFVLPSLSEGLPMAVLEAIQNGCIPIITDECNLPELIRDGVALRIASDFHDFESVINSALTMTDLEVERRSAAVADYARRYHWSTIGEKMHKKYLELI
ncbi:glycosyltransferase [Azoarcus sp. L1K30]|uniref:glycosyltransferase n=1 Tax=Azoarcus sp. L1K30 TaxID=2820277 RepID=UPI001B828BC5|nr:glycosyltransferase [Azoarcus sp. L1K30]MBR0564506.1 glycosyltransferase [Azoarcus sp. L1K30]